MSAGINKALAYIDAHLTEPFTEGDLAAKEYAAVALSGAFSQNAKAA